MRIEYNEAARTLVRELVAGDPMLPKHPAIMAWNLTAKLEVMVVVEYDNGSDDSPQPRCMALIHKLEYDPLGTHARPVMLDYIHTFEGFRAAGYASKLLQKLKKRNHLTAICPTEQAAVWFRKVGFFVSPERRIARFPFSPKDGEADMQFAAKCMISDAVEARIVEVLIFNHRQAQLPGISSEKYALHGMAIQNILTKLEAEFSKKIMMNVFMKACKILGQTLSPLSGEFVAELRRLNFLCIAAKDRGEERGP